MGLDQMRRGKRRPIFLVRIRPLFALDGRDGSFDGFDRFSMPAFDQRRFGPATANQILPRNFDAVAAQRGLLDLWIDVMRIVMLTVAAKPEQLSDDQLWSLSFTRSGYNISHHLEAF